MNEINFTSKARYFTYGDSKTATKLLFVLHGYGQLAQYFIRKFQHLNETDVFIIAPEGPHRFYKTGTAGRVGASWMTKENREQDIINYTTYLTAIYNEVTTHKKFSERILLGFSQGGATASRWHGKGLTDFNVFILWAAIFPEDMPLNYELSFLSSKNYFIFGNNDEFYSLEKVNKHNRAISKLGLSFTFDTFSGNHDINTELIGKLINE